VNYESNYEMAAAAGGINRRDNSVGCFAENDLHAGEEGSREVLLHRDVSDENREGGGLEWQAKEKSKFSQRAARFVKTHCSW
jgi:hypothetical protein